MLQFDKKLPACFNFVIAYFYNIKGKICFGVLTFFPEGGKEFYSDVGRGYKVFSYD
jgi:hypothetical protein